MLNANEPEATVVEVVSADKAYVNPGDILITIETTKAAADLESEISGYFQLTAHENQTLKVGDVYGYITDNADDSLPQENQHVDEKLLDNADLRITTPARNLALKNHINLQTLPKNQLITESFIRGLIQKNLRREIPVGRKILVYGAGGHAKALMEMIKAGGNFELAGIVDDSSALKGRQVFGVPILGSGDLLESLLEQGIENAANGVGGIIDQVIRAKIFERLIEAGFYLPSIIHPSAVVEKSAKIGLGTQIFANSYVGSQAILDDMCMVNTGAVISHDCVVGRYTHIAPGAMLAGAVIVKNNVLIGMGVTTAIGITIGKGARVGNGSTILKDVPAGKIISAGEVWR